jgi:hypothetical protein
MKKMLHMSVLMVLALFALLPSLGVPLSGVAEAAQVKEQTATASWTECKSNICVDTVIIAADPGGKKTLSFEETRYRKNGNVINRRAGFVKNVNFKQNGLKSASVDARVKVDRCDAQDICKKAGAVHVKASWTGNGSKWIDKELGKRLRDATVESSVDGQSPGSLLYAVLTEDVR